MHFSKIHAPALNYNLYFLDDRPVALLNLEPVYWFLSFNKAVFMQKVHGANFQILETPARPMG